MTPQTTQVTYIVTSYNHRKYILQAIESIEAQRCGGLLEILVCDDASTDGSRELLAELERNGRIRLLLNDRNRGLIHSLNRGIAAASGEYVCWIGSDDWTEPSKVSTQLEYLRRNPVDAVLSRTWVVDEQSGTRELQRLSGIASVIAEGHYLERLYHGDSGLPLVPSGMFKLSAVRATTFLDSYKSDDWLFMIRFMQKGFKLGFVDIPTLNYRMHAGNTHKHAVRCLSELELPVIRDFIPPEYHREALSAVYYTTALKLVAHEPAEATRYAYLSMRQRLSARRLAVLGAVALRRAPGGDSSFRVLRRVVQAVRTRLTDGRA